MSDLRRDPISGRWVIIAPERAGRPSEFQSVPVPEHSHLCPFCEGNEAETPGEVLAYRSPDSQPNQPGWYIRAVPNKFPALQSYGSLEEKRSGIFQQMTGVGCHEVIIESPRHLTSTSELSDKQVERLFCVYRDRLVDLSHDERLVYGLVFKNAGPPAGATLSHTHSQLLATPVLPFNVSEELASVRAFFDRHGGCLFCEMIQVELAGQHRIVEQSSNLIAFCPFAGRFPYETWILPKSHASHFEWQDDASLGQLACLVRRIICRMESVISQCAYNYLIHTAPFDTGQVEHYHWHIEIFPRLTKLAGFEWGTGYCVNPVPPEEAAKLLRNSHSE